MLCVLFPCRFANLSVAQLGLSSEDLITFLLCFALQVAKCTNVVGKGANCVTCLDVEKKCAVMASASGAAMASGSGAKAPVASGAAQPMRKARTVGQIRLKAVSSKTLFT